MAHGDALHALDHAGMIGRGQHEPAGRPEHATALCKSARTVVVVNVLERFHHGDEIERRIRKRKRGYVGSGHIERNRLCAAMLCPTANCAGMRSTPVASKPMRPRAITLNPHAEPTSSTRAPLLRSKVAVHLQKTAHHHVVPRHGPKIPVAEEIRHLVAREPRWNLDRRKRHGLTTA
jgi:hypothetical protein